MYKIKKEINILGSDVFRYRVLKRKWFLFIPFFSKKVFKNKGYGRFLITRTEEEAKTLIDIINK